MSLIRAAFYSLILLPAVAFAATESVDLGRAGRAGVSLEENDEGAALKIFLPGGKVQNEEGLGQEFVPIMIEGKEHRLVQIDLDKDGAEEFCVRAIVPPASGAMFCYRFHDGKFAALPFGAEEFLVVDAAAPVRLGKDGKITADIVVKSSGNSKIEKLNWAFENGKFVEKK